MRFALKFEALMLLLPLMVGCAPQSRSPDLSSREAFAKSVMSSAASGSVESVEKLVPEDRIDIRPGAQQLVDSARGWDPASWTMQLSNDVPEAAVVTVAPEGKSATVKYEISWNNDKWGLILGTSKNHPPTGGAVPGPPGTGTSKVIEPPK